MGKHKRSLAALMDLQGWRTGMLADAAHEVPITPSRVEQDASGDLWVPLADYRACADRAALAVGAAAALRRDAESWKGKADALTKANAALTEELTVSRAAQKGHA